MAKDHIASFSSSAESSSSKPCKVKVERRPEPLLSAISSSPQIIKASDSTPSSKSIKYERVFRHFDTDEDGRISPAELCACLATMKEEISLEEAEAVVALADSDGDGLLSLEEFVGLVEVDGEEEKNKDLRLAFGKYEMDGCGCITPKSLKRMLSRLGESKTMEECSAMISRFDLNGDGVLSFDEFAVMMR